MTEVPARLSIVTLGVRNMGVLRSFYRALGWRELTDRSWGGRSAFMADPEGNRWEITWSPRATFDARGALLSWG
jgi:hypothetical protein